MIVIGSKSLLFRLEQTPEIQERYNNSDFDVIMSFKDFSAWQKENKQYLKSLFPREENKYKAIVEKDGVRKQYEIELGFGETSSTFLLNHIDEVTDGTITGLFGETYHTLKPEYQLLTKRSHLIYPVHFEKNINDYHTLKSFIGDFVRNENMELYYKLRSDEAKVRFSKFKTPSLNVTNEDFFSSKLAVEHYFVHDDIHEVMKHHDKPVYEMMKRDFNLAKCEKDMFFELPYQYQVQAVQEEAYTIALERYIIPQVEGFEDYFSCYKRAVLRICTTLCSGWFRDFAIENYTKAIEWYNPNFVEIFKKAVENGEISPIEGKTLEDVPKLA